MKAMIGTQFPLVCRWTASEKSLKALIDRRTHPCFSSSSIMADPRAFGENTSEPLDLRNKVKKNGPLTLVNVPGSPEFDERNFTGADESESKGSVEQPGHIAVKLLPNSDRGYDNRQLILARASTPRVGVVAKGAGAASNAFRRFLVFWVGTDDPSATAAQQEGRAIETVGPSGDLLFSPLSYRPEDRQSGAFQELSA